MDIHQAFIDDAVLLHNQRNTKTLSIEKSTLQPLSKIKTMDYIHANAGSGHQ